MFCEKWTFLLLFGEFLSIIHAQRGRGHIDVDKKSLLILIGKARYRRFTTNKEHSLLAMDFAVAKMLNKNKGL